MFPWRERIHQGVKIGVESPLVVSLAARQRPIETQVHPSPARFARPLLFMWWIPLTCILCFGRARPCDSRSIFLGDHLAIRSGPRSCPPHWQSDMVAPVRQRRPPVFLESLDKHQCCSDASRSEHFLLGPCLSTRRTARRGRWSLAK